MLTASMVPTALRILAFDANTQNPDRRHVKCDCYSSGFPSCPFVSGEPAVALAHEQHWNATKDEKPDQRDPEPHIRIHWNTLVSTPATLILFSACRFAADRRRAATRNHVSPLRFFASQICRYLIVCRLLALASEVRCSCKQ